MPKKIINLEYRNGVLVDTESNKLVTGDQLKTHNKTHDYRIVNVNENKLATGVAINQYRKSAVNFLQDLNDYDVNKATIYDQIELSNKIFRFEETVSTGTEVLIDFAISDFEIVGIPDEHLVLFKEFEEKVNFEGNFTSYGLRALAESLALEYFISGNIFLWEVWGDFENQRLPIHIQLLNPLNVDIDSIAFQNGEQKIKFGLGPKTRTRSGLRVEDMLRDSTRELSQSPRFRGLMEEDGTLDNRFISHIKRKARDYDMWGVPYLTKLAQAVTYKQKLWQLDISTIDGLVNYIIIFRIGSSDPNSEYHIVERERIEAFAGLLKAPQRSTMLTWAHDVDIVVAGPNGEILNFTEKFKEANRAIIQGLGVPPILIDGTGTATAAWVTVLALNKRLDKLRSMIKNYIEYILMKIRDQNNLGDFKPEVVWFPTDLQDERTIKNLLLAFWDRGLLPIQTAHRESGRDHTKMVDLKRIEIQEGLDELFSRRDVPFSPQPQDQSPGRPADDTRTQEEAKNIFQEAYEERILSILDILERDIDQLEDKSQSNIMDLVDVSLIRIHQVSEVFAREDNKDALFEAKVSLWNAKFIDRLKAFVSENISKFAKRKTDKQIFLSGVFGELRKRARLFAKESFRNIELANELAERKLEGFVGAEIETNPNTDCEFCRDLNGQFLSLEKIFEILPAHPHQAFSLKYTKENPVRDGKKKNKVVRQDPKRKSKKL